MLSGGVKILRRAGDKNDVNHKMTIMIRYTEYYRLASGKGIYKQKMTTELREVSRFHGSAAELAHLPATHADSIVVLCYRMTVMREFAKIYEVMRIVSVFLLAGILMMAGTGNEPAVAAPGLVLECSVSKGGRPDAAGSRSFCAALSSRLREAGLAILTSSGSREGVEAVRVKVNRTAASHAKVELTSGIYRAGTFVAGDRQELDIDVVDAGFGAGSAGVLVRPVLLLLKRVK